MLTAALVPLLTGSTVITWLDALEMVRSSVPPALTVQRPEVEGPADRLLFTVQARSGQGVLPVRVTNGAAVLPGAEIFGIAAGDRYELLAPGAERPLGGAVVEYVREGDAVLALDGTLRPEDLPPGVSAWPVDVALVRRSVAVLPVGNPGRDRLAAYLEDSAMIRPVEDSGDVLATVRLDGETVHVADAIGQPLSAEPMSLAEAVEAVRTLAVAEYIRQLSSGTGRAALPPDVDVSYVRLLQGGGEVELTSGEHLFADDRVSMRITNLAGERRYVTVIDVGLAGAVSPLTTSEPSGVTLEPGERYELGPQWGGGMPLTWPQKLPPGDARMESFVTVVADRRVDRLGRLAQPGITRDAAATNSLERMLDCLDTGRRDVRQPGALDGVRWWVERFDFLLHPAPRLAADEPAFEIDERPDPSFRLVTPRGANVPSRVAVRLKELTVHSNRAFLQSRVRVDAIVVTAAPAEAGGPYSAATMHFDRIRDGDRLPFDDVLVYEGPVARFLDIAMWVARDDSPDVGLAELMAAETANQEVAGAVSALAALAVAEPTAAVVAGSVAAVAVLVRAAAQGIDQTRGSSIGGYRTTLLPHQRFGVADGIGRHPVQGLLKAQDMSLAFEIVDLTPGYRKAESSPET